MYNDVFAYIISFAGIVSALSVIALNIFSPIKKTLNKLKVNSQSIYEVKEELKLIWEKRSIDNKYSLELRSILIESFFAILDGLEQNGANGEVSLQKKKLLQYLSKNKC